MAESVYLTRWLGWIGVEDGSTPSMRLAVVNKPTLEDIDISEVSAGNVLPVDSWTLSKGSKEKSYQLLSMHFFLEPLLPGIYEINEIELTFSDESTGIWDIGSIIIDVIKPIDEQYVRVGVHTGLDDDPEWNRVELTNISSEVICVKSLQFSIPGLSVEESIHTAHRYDSIYWVEAGDKYCLEPEENKYFQFDLVVGDVPDCIEYFVIQPRVIMEVDGREVVNSLYQVVYGKWFIDDEYVDTIVDNDGPIQTTN